MTQASNNRVGNQPKAQDRWCQARRAFGEWLFKLALTMQFSRFSLFYQLTIRLLPIALLAGSPLLAQVLIDSQTKDTVRLTVNRVERVVDRRGTDARYMVFTDQESFENTDAPLLGKVNAADLHGRIKAGATYQARVTGLRVPLLSWYRNILSLQELPAPSTARPAHRRSHQLPSPPAQAKGRPAGMG